MPTTPIDEYVTQLNALLQRSDVKHLTVKARLMEHAYITGVAVALGGVAKLPPAIAMSAMAGRSILTLAAPQAMSQE